MPRLKSGAGPRTYTGGRKANGDAKVLMSCWCEKEMVHVPLSWVGIRTESCGEDDCHE